MISVMLCEYCASDVARASTLIPIKQNRLVLEIAAPKPILIVPPATVSIVPVEPPHQNSTILGWKPRPVMAWISVASLVGSILNEPTIALYAILYQPDYKSI